jgi:hypothetical protein
MKMIKALLVGALLAVTACAYASVAASGDKVIIAREGLIWGLGRAVFVCQIADNGVSNCQSNEAP